jgi:hypothetical protein
MAQSIDREDSAIWVERLSREAPTGLRALVGTDTE